MCRRVSSPFSLLKRIAAVVAATIYLTGCGIEIVDVTAPTSVTSGQPFEIEVTQQFFQSGGFSETGETRLVFVFVVPEAWSPQAGGSYDGEFDGYPLSLNVEVLDTIESGWNDLLYDPEAASPCLEEYAEDENAQDDCAVYKALDAVEFVPFFYDGGVPSSRRSYIPVALCQDGGATNARFRGRRYWRSDDALRRGSRTAICGRCRICCGIGDRAERGSGRDCWRAPAR